MLMSDVLQDSLEEVTKLAKFLGVNFDIEFLKRVDRLCQFDNLKSEKDPLENVDYWRDKIPTTYRKGKAKVQLSS